jgi:ribose transport system ATP-binding protein
MEPDPSPLLSIRALTKRFPGVTALKDVDLEVVPGEVHALVGENGAGKSSLVKVLGGIHQPDSGEMSFAGDAYRPQSTSDALGAGIRLVHQELNLLPYLSVAENLFMDALPHRLGLLDRRTLHRRSRELLDEVGLDIPVSTKVERLGIAQMQLVEIAKAISGDSRLLIMDEPTATLTPRETDRLFGIIRRLSEQGVAVIYISHHLDEVFEIGDRVTVLRNGCNVGTHEVADLSVPAIVTMMVGRDLAHEYPPRGVAAICAYADPATPCRSRPIEANSSVWRAWSVPGVPRPCERSSARIRTTAERSTSEAPRWPSRTRSRPWRTASACSPRTARARDSCWT